MSLLLIARAEIICLGILVFIVFCSRFYNMGKDKGRFLRICIYGIGHTVFDLITVITVNNIGVIPDPINKVCHIIFYLTALLFSYEFFCYTISICYAKKMLRRIQTVGLIPIVLYACVVYFLPMTYEQGKGTLYSFGLAAIVGYGVAMFLFIMSIAVVVRNLKKLDRYIVGALLPMLCAAIVAEVTQIIVPEMLFTGGTITLITVGFFFSLENPVVVLRQKVLTDALTGVKSRHSYEADMVKFEKCFESGDTFGMVFFDINGLKAVNDTLGHLVGDEYIGCVAQVLMEELKSADGIYRMGGDEFLAIYRNKDEKTIKKELDGVNSGCEAKSEKKQYQVSVAMGLAFSDKQFKSLRKVLRMADFRMYANKAKIKQRRSYLLDNSDDVNISGLTDRIFDAFAVTDSNRFLFVTNMMTGVTRWSISAAEYLGLGSVFIYECNNLLAERVHADDRDTFIDDTTAIMSGKQEFYESEYRILNANKDYVTCACNGTYLRGKNDEPDLFAGTMLIKEAADSIDQITGLRNSREMMNYFNYLIRSGIPTALIQVSILNLSRINMLYGYECGNEILKQFASIVHITVGKCGELFCSGSTKFVICMPNATKSDVADMYRKIRHASEQQIRLESITPPLKLAAGAYMLEKNNTAPASFLHSNLIFAYDRSKNIEHGNLVFYDGRPDMLLSGNHKSRLLTIHQDAIGEREGFFMVYQPIVNVESGKIVGAEALLRWQDENFGVVPPGQFIPWLEGDPCFFGLGNWILRTSVVETKRLLRNNPDFILNVNVAMQQIENEEFGDIVLDILNQTGFPARNLCFELTERCRELNIDTLKAQISFFRRNGIRVALDDFGTGFSSFGLLLNLKVDEIKIDQTFVREIKTNHSNQILTKMIIESSANMGYSTCLEGVETDELCQHLSDYNSTYYQGYYCSKPIKIDEFEAHMKKWNSKN